MDNIQKNAFIENATVIKETDEERYQKGMNLINQRDFVNGYGFIYEAAVNGHSMSQNMMGLAYYRNYGTKRSLYNALYWFTKAAKQGNPFAMYNIAGMYLMGNGVRQSNQKALEWYEKARQAGHEDSGYMAVVLKSELGMGDVVPTKYDLYNYAMFLWDEEEYELALEYVHKAINKGAKAAYHILGIACEKGFGTIRDYKKAETYYLIASEEGVPESAYFMGQMYEFGRGPKSDYQKALLLYNSAAMRGNNRAKTAHELLHRKINISDKVEIQQGMPADYYYQQALQCEREGMYSEASLHAYYGLQQGHVGAAYMRARDCQYGLGVYPNIEEAIRLYRVAVEKGSLDACVELGRIYEYGIGVEKNEEVAFKYYLDAQEWNHPTVYKSLYRLIKKNSDLYDRFMQEIYASDEVRFKQDFSETEVYAQAGLGVDHRFVCGIGAELDYPEALEAMAVWYLSGAYGEKNYKKAKECLDKMARYGSEEAVEILTDVEEIIKNEDCREYFENLSDDELYNILDEIEGRTIYLTVWYAQILADRGNPAAQGVIGEAYFNHEIEEVYYDEEGCLISRSDEYAFKWLSKAAEQQDEISCYYLGQMYQEGRFVESDYVQAKKYYEKALDGGIEEARILLEDIIQQIQ